jgi:membrane fusion protein, multidrug efflux system
MAQSMVNKKTAVRTIIMLVLVGILMGGVITWHFIVHGFIAKAMAAQSAPIATVSTTVAKFDDWQSQLSAVGSTRAVRGVDVTTEIAALVRSINFKSGQDVKKGDLLVQLNADSDIATLHSLEATADLSKVVLNRDKQQLSVEAVAQATVDNDLADLKSKLAQVASQQAIIDKKTIRAPFSGRLGISTVNPGQYLNPGDKIVTLQSIDPILIDFTLPQQDLATLAVGQSISVTTDAYPNKVFAGKLSAIDPKVDTSTRNVSVEATVANDSKLLFPGMYGHALVNDGKSHRFITLPQSAITFNAYGSTVFVAKQAATKDGKGQQLTAQQVFVTTGETRGDQIAVLTGVNEGDTVVTSGQLKLFNGTPLAVDNTVLPTDDAHPTPQEH